MKEYRVNTMQGADGRLRTSYFQGDAARVAGKHVKAFNKELKRYDKVFSDYASYQETDDVYSQNSRYIFGKLGIAEKYVEHISEEDMIDGVGIETAAVAGSKHASKMGVKAKIAKFFQPAFEKQAQKHPALQGLSDRVSKAANNGRLPLTADSAAMMKIAFDKRYYREIREPGANVEEIREKYESAVGNLRNLAQRDGVSPKALSQKLGEKLAEQIQVDETLTDVYKGMSTGDIRFAPDEPVLNRNGEPLRVRGRVLYKTSQSFVDKDGNALDPFDFQPREPQSIDEIVAEYKEQLSAMTKNCRTEAGFKKALESPTYKNLFRNANEFASSDCPDEADKFRYEMRRAGLMCCKEWALKNDITHPYANIKIPEPYDDVIVGSDFNKRYATADYYEEDLDIEQEAYEETVAKSDAELAADLRQDVSNTAAELNNIDMLQDRTFAIEVKRDELIKKTDIIKDNEYSDEIGTPVIDAEFTDVDDLSPVEHIAQISSETETRDYFVCGDGKTFLEERINKDPNAVSGVRRTFFDKFDQIAEIVESARNKVGEYKDYVVNQDYKNIPHQALEAFKQSEIYTKAKSYFDKTVIAIGGVGAAKTAYDIYTDSKPEKPDTYAEACANIADIGNSEVSRALIEQMKEATPGIDLNKFGSTSDIDKLDDPNYDPDPEYNAQQRVYEIEEREAGYNNKMTPEEWDEYFKRLDAKENEVSEDEIGDSVGGNFAELDVDTEEPNNENHSVKIGIEFVDPAGDGHNYVSDKAVDLVELMQTDKQNLYKYCKDNDDLKAIDDAQMAEMEQNGSGITVVSFDTDLEAYLQNENEEPVVANIRTTGADGKYQSFGVTQKMIESAVETVEGADDAQSVEERNQSFIETLKMYAQTKQVEAGPAKEIPSEQSEETSDLEQDAETAESDNSKESVSSDQPDITEVMEKRASELDDLSASADDASKDDEPKF